MDPDWLLVGGVLSCYALFWMALGASIGSFLNVVVYRLPRGLSLSYPPSSCPACRQRIRWYDNVPVLGWVLLRGRCRDCRFPISVRYPVVEALGAALFVTLAFVELFSGGANLPYRRREPAGLWNLGQASVELHVLVVVHFVLFLALLALALIDQDGLRPPPGLVLFPLGLFAVVSLIWTPVHPDHPLPGLAVGLGAGFALGMLYDPRTRARVPATVAGLALIGTILGWQTALVATAGGVAVLLVVLASAPAFVWRIPISPVLPAAVTAFVWLVSGGVLLR